MGSMGNINTNTSTRNRRRRTTTTVDTPTPTTPPPEDTSTTVDPITTTDPITPNWYTPTNVFLPPGVDPYYGVSITGINGSSSGGGSTPNPQDGTGGGKTRDSSDLMTDPNNSLWSEYNNYYSSAAFNGTDPLSFEQWNALRQSFNGSNTSKNTEGTGIGNYNGNFMIARPNMTWANSLPTVAPGTGQAALDAYGPLPFTREANTPGATYIKPQLTYNNPYNTNPYLPTANPFALIANSPTSGS